MRSIATAITTHTSPTEPVTHEGVSRPYCCARKLTPSSRTATIAPSFRWGRRSWTSRFTMWTVIDRTHTAPLPSPAIMRPIDLVTLRPPNTPSREKLASSASPRRNMKNAAKPYKTSCVFSGSSSSPRRSSPTHAVSPQMLPNSADERTDCDCGVVRYMATMTASATNTTSFLLSSKSEKPPAVSKKIPPDEPMMGIAFST